MDIAAAELRDAVLYQLGALDAFAQVAGREVDYVKPHGRCTTRRSTASAQAEAWWPPSAEYDPSLAILGQPDSELLAAPSEPAWRRCPRRFVDRAYRPDGRLVPRPSPGR